MTSKTQSRSVFQRIDHAILTVVAWVITIGIFLFSFAFVAALFLFLVGCAKKDIVLADKEAPLFVSDTGLFEVRVAAWDEDKDTLVDLGWYDNSILSGRTISTFDWDAYARRVRFPVTQFEVDGQIDLDLLKKSMAELAKDKIVILDPPSNYERSKFLAVCQKLRPDLEFEFASQ